MAYIADHLRSRFISRTYLHDPADATVATKIAWIRMGLHFLAKAMLVSGTGILTFKIFAATDSSGSNPTEVVAHATPTVADAQGDQLVLEVDAPMVLAALARATHVSVELDCDAAGDVVTLDYLMQPHETYAALTVDVIA